MTDAMLIELADLWELQAETDKTPNNEGGRVALRACADTLRMLVDSTQPKDCPHAAPHRYCAECPVRPCPVGLGKS